MQILFAQVVSDQHILATVTPSSKIKDQDLPFLIDSDQSRHLIGKTALLRILTDFVVVQKIPIAVPRLATK